MPKIYVAGHKGLVGSALTRVAKRKGYKQIVTRDHSEVDLLDAKQVGLLFETEKPEWVMLAAAKVGGIYANDTFPADFLLQNLKIQNNVIEAAFRHRVKKLLFLGSSCVYPKHSPSPIHEEALLSSALEKTNEAYAVAKIAGLKLCEAFNRQYQTNYLCVMPANLYGLNDNYHSENAHALPMLLRRFHEAKMNCIKTVTVWGSGRPRREFLFADDLAEACFFLMENHDASQLGGLVNIGTGKDLTIAYLAEQIKQTVGFEGEIVFDHSKPDGTMVKCLDVSKVTSLGWRYRIELEEGLRLTYEDFRHNQHLRV